MIVLGMFLLLILTLAASAFCSACETGFLSVSRERVLHLAREGGRKAQYLHRAISDLSKTTTTILIGNNIANVSYSAVAAAMSDCICRDSASRLVWSFLAAFLVLYLSEFLPKLFCSARPLRRSLALARPYGAMEALLRPLVTAAVRLTDLFLPRKDAKYRLTSADLLRILQDRKDGVCLSDIESALIGRLIVLRIKNRPITADALLSVLREDSSPSAD